MVGRLFAGLVQPLTIAAAATTMIAAERRQMESQMLGSGVLPTQHCYQQIRRR